MKTLLLTILLLLATPAYAQIVTTASLSTVQAETDAVYEATQSATVYDGKSVLKDYIRQSLLAGQIPSFYADKVSLDTFLNAAKNAYEDVGGSLFILNVKSIFTKVNLAHEIRVEAKKNGWTVNNLIQAKSI